MFKKTISIISIILDNIFISKIKSLGIMVEIYIETLQIAVNINYLIERF